jgi:hypothetical protein
MGTIPEQRGMGLGTVANDQQCQSDQVKQVLEATHSMHHKIDEY